MGHDPDVATFRIGGLTIADLDMTGLVASVRRYIGQGAGAAGAYVAFCGAHGVVESDLDPRVRDAHQNAWLVVADGRPLFWFGRLRGYRTVRQVPGIESIEAVCRAGLPDGWAHYFLGGAPGVAELLADTMADRVPGLRVAGCETPPFRALSGDEIEAMRARIRASGAQVLWIGLGAPKQELFMAEHAVHLPGTIAMGVGAAFDVNTGRVRRAPRAFRVLGLEWAFRLALEPRRLWSRYSVVVPRFVEIAVATLAAAWIGTGRGEMAGATSPLQAPPSCATTSRVAQGTTESASTTGPANA